MRNYEAVSKLNIKMMSQFRQNSLTSKHYEENNGVNMHTNITPKLFMHNHL